jgi:phosphate transport system substrate-binding protein
MHLYLLITLALLGRIAYAQVVSTTIVGADTPITTLFISDTILAYQLEAPNVTLSMQTGSSSFNENLLFTNSVDFAISSLALTSLQQELHPTVSAFPFVASAIVPIYRLDSLGQFAPPVIFNRSVLAQIYAGEIVWWNDSLIQGANPTIVLPNKTITLVLDTVASAGNQVFVDALCQFYTPICTQVPSSILPVWPRQNYAKYVLAAGEIGITATVTTLDNSLGYTVLSVALDNFASVGSMINKAGSTVKASASSVEFAMVELATASSRNDVSLNDASGASAWPINVMSYLLVNLEYTRDTCAIRLATLNFWLFIYHSSVVIKLAQSRQYALLPQLLSDVFFGGINIGSLLLCNGVPVASGNLQQQILIGGTDRLSFLSEMLVNLYNVPTDPTQYVYSPLTSQVAWDRFQSAELDVAFFYQSDLSSATIKTLRSSSQFLVIPTFLTSVAPIFNPQITPNVNLGSYSIIIDLGTYFRMLFSNITDWKDPSILRYNPSLAIKLGNQSAPITTVYGCKSTPIILQLVRWAQTYGTSLDTSITTFMKNVISNTAFLTGFGTCVPPKNYNIVYTPNEGTTFSLVSTIIGSVGYAQDRSPSSSGEFTIMYPRSVDGNTQLVSTSSTSNSMIACITDTFSVSTLSINPQASSNPACWPFTTAVYLAVRNSYTAAATDTSQCEQGLKALKFVQWLITTPLLDAATHSQSSPRPAGLFNIESAIIDALNNVTCDGTTMLITLPVVWSLTSAASGFGIAMSVIGLIGILGLLILVAVYRNHPVMRSASPWFVFTSLSGVGLMLISLFFWVSNATVANCNAFSWCINLGFMLTFAPLFAKTWRIYRIFGRKKLSVIKISNRKLGLMVSTFISAEIAILSVWQAVGPLQPVVTMQTTGNPVIEHQYTQCGTVGDGSRFLIVIGVTKGVLLLYGALLAFSTRRVTDHFNESQSIAWAIYNVVFSVGIVIPIIVFVGAVGDVIVMLVLFVILWIAYFTALIIIVPKVMAVFAPSSQLNSAELSGTKSSVGGFSFLSIAEMTRPVLLMQYQSALREQLKLVTQKLEHVTSVTGVRNTSVGDRSKIVASPTRESRVNTAELPRNRLLKQPPTASISSSSEVTAFSPVARLSRVKSPSETEILQIPSPKNPIPTSDLVSSLPGLMAHITEDTVDPN